MNFCRVSNDNTIVGEVLKQITEAIVQGALKPGDKIPTELELMDKFGVGRNSVREAIKMLCAMGVLEVKRGSGTFVTKEISPVIFNPLIFSLILDRRAAGDLYELRTMFEAMVLWLVIDKITEEGIFDLEQLLDKVQSLYEQKEASKDDVTQLDRVFHHTMLQFTYNPLIQRIGETIIDLFPSYVGKSMLQENGLEQYISNRRRVFRAIKEKDKSTVLSVLEESLLPWKMDWPHKEKSPHWSKP